MFQVETNLTRKLTGLAKKVRRAGLQLHGSMPVVVRDSVRQFRYQFEVDQLDRRMEGSLGRRTGQLKAALTHEMTVRKRPRIITGGVHFGRKDSLSNKIARVHERGAVIRPKGRFLVYKIEKRYSRRSWPFSSDEVWIRTKKPSVIRPRLGLRRTWQKYKPIARRHVLKGVVTALKRGFR